MPKLAFLHIAVIALTNLMVQFPFTLFRFHSTWGSFTYPLIFIITDLTVRLKGSKIARLTVLEAMLPGLILSYCMANFFATSSLHALFNWNELAFRITIASFSAYIIGQLIDIMIFQKLRENNKWWIAPACSSFIGNIVDTFLFFAIAFFHSSNLFFANHWIEIAIVDLAFKIGISLMSFIPLYGLILRWLKPHKSHYHYITTSS